MRQVLQPKLVEDTRTEEFDFTSALATGETISTAVVTADLWAGADTTPSAIINGAATISGNIVSQSVTAGEVGNIYQLRCQITTSAGQTLNMTAYLAVIEDVP